MKKDIIVFLGQSNMQGETECQSECQPVENGYEYRFLSDTLIPLHNPVGENISTEMTAVYPYEEMTSLQQWLKDTVLLASEKGSTNMVPSFIRSYTEVTGHMAVAVHAAKGSTVISYWEPGTVGYNAIVRKTTAAVEKVGREQVGEILIVWLQGESDMIVKTTGEDYQRKLTLIKDGLFHDIGASVFGIIRVGPFTSVVDWFATPYSERLANDRAIISAQEAVCKRDSDFVMLTAITDKMMHGDEKYRNPNVGGHYSAFGQETLGKIAGHNLGAYVTGRKMTADDDIVL